MIVGQMALAGFPMWEMCLSELSKHCDELYLRIDLNKCDSKITIDDYNKICNGKVKKLLEIKEPFHKWKFREQMLRMTDDVKPEIVINLDEDEVFDNGIDNEISEFRKSNMNHMMFNYNSMPTEDGKQILNNLPYPRLPHCKIYKWSENLTYFGYHGNCLIPGEHTKHNRWMAKTKINHFCFYDKSTYKEKVENMKIYSLKNYFKTYYGMTLGGFDT